MARKQPIKTVTLDPDVWCRDLMRGETTSLLFFVEERRQQCCIGVACTALGLSDAAIKGKEYALNLAEIGRLPRAIRALSKTRSKKVYIINDQRGGSDVTRVAELNTELKEAKIPLRFRLGKPRAGAKARTKEHAVTTSASAAQE